MGPESPFLWCFYGPIGAEFVQSELGFAPNTPGFGGKGRSGVVLVFLALLCVNAKLGGLVVFPFPGFPGFLWSFPVVFF